MRATLIALALRDAGLISYQSKPCHSVLAFQSAVLKDYHG